MSNKIEQMRAHYEGLLILARAEIAALTEALREPREAAIEAAAIAECNFQVGVNSIWESPLIDRSYRMEKMRCALAAAGNAALASPAPQEETR